MTISPNAGYAGEAFNSASSLITDNVTTITDFGLETQNRLASTIQAMSGVKIDSPAPVPPLVGVPPPTAAVFATADFAAVNDGYERELSPPLTPIPPIAGEVKALLAPVVSSAAPDMPAWVEASFAAAPTIDVEGAPARPTIDTTIHFPAAPVLRMPSMPTLLPVSVPTFVFSGISAFGETAPSVDFALPNPAINWVEPEYTATAELGDEIRRLMSGGSGMPAAVEAALFARARQREDIAGAKLVSEAFDTFAARNFSLPPGALVKQVNVANEINRSKASELNRDTFIEAAKWELESVRFAIQQSLALENIKVSIFDNAAKRSFEVAKYHAEAQVALFNNQVTLFNVRAQVFQTLATAYKTKIEGELAGITAFKAEIDAQAAIGQMNEQNVRTYSAAVQAATAEIDAYKATMAGVQAQAEVVKSQVEVYRADIQAFAEKVSARKVTFELHKLNVDAEIAKFGVNDVAARAYATAMQGYAVNAEVNQKNAGLAVEQARALISERDGDVQRFKAETEGASHRASEATARFRAGVDAWVARAHQQTAETEGGYRLADAQVRQQTDHSTLLLKQYDAAMHKAGLEANLMMDGLKTAAQVDSQLAAGALSALHMSAQVSGSGQFSNGATDSTSTNHNYSY